jgi:hypothetical protein
MGFGGGTVDPVPAALAMPPKQINAIVGKSASAPPTVEKLRLIFMDVSWLLVVTQNERSCRLPTQVLIRIDSVG